MKVIVQRALDKPVDAMPDEAAFERWGMAIDRGGREVCVRLVEDREARDLNRRYRRQTYVPNVLAFPFSSPLAETRDYLGDLVIAAHRAVVEARQLGTAAEHHWARLFVHGVLHLQGYDHQSERQARRMQSAEASVLRKLGIVLPGLSAAAPAHE